MERIKYVGLLIFILGCSSKNPDYNAFIGKLNLEKDKKALIISCIKCECIIEQLYLLKKKNPGLLGQYTIYADTPCIKNLAYRGDKVKYIRQQALDSVSVDFYNMLIYNPGKYGSKLRMVKTEESEQIEKMMQ